MGNCLGICGSKANLENDRYLVNDRRDSFMNRICDDLCEVILQYLSLEDKLRLECVSKQFQRNVFQRHYELNLDFFSKILIYRRRIRYESKIRELTLVLKKCPNIKHIYMSAQFRMCDEREYIDVILKNCKFTKITDSSYDHNTDLIRLIDVFGPRLKYLEFINNYDSSLKLESLTSVEELYLPIKQQRARCNFNYHLDLNFPRLKKFSATLTDENYKDILKFIRNNPGISSLYLSMNFVHKSMEPAVLLQLSRLKNLKHIDPLYFEPDYSDATDPLTDLDDYERAVNLLGVNCTQLKSIICYINAESDNFLKLSQILSPLKRFRQLKRLEVTLVYPNTKEWEDLNLEGMQDNENLIFENVAGFDKLSHLSIRSNLANSNIMEMLINNMIFYSRNIQSLVIYDRIGGSMLTFNLLCFLSKLESIDLVVCDMFLKDNESVLKKYCTNIKRSMIRYVPAPTAFGQIDRIVKNHSPTEQD